MIGATCPACQTIHAAGDVVPSGSRFSPAGVQGYRPRAGGPPRPTREEVQADLCAERQAGAPS